MWGNPGCGESQDVGKVGCGENPVTGDNKLWGKSVCRENMLLKKPGKISVWGELCCGKIQTDFEESSSIVHRLSKLPKTPKNN